MQNQRDVSTVVSVVPFPIHEEKPGIYPGEFSIPPAKENDFQIIHVERAINPIYIDETRPRIVIPTLSDTMAESLIRDYVIAKQCYVANEAEPGLFWVRGELDKATVGSVHKMELAAARERQNNWFKRLVERADDEWNRFHQHKMITDEQRYAVKALGLERDWVTQQQIDRAASKCPVCFSLVHPEAIICMACTFVLRPDEFAKNKARFVNMMAAAPIGTPEPVKK